MKNPVRMEVEEAIKKLEEDGLYSRCWYWVTGRLGVVVYNLQKIMFGILKDHEDALVLEYNLNQMNDIWMR